MILQDHLADNFFLILIQGITEKSQPLFVVCELFLQTIRDGTDVFCAHLFFTKTYTNE